MCFVHLEVRGIAKTFGVGGLATKAKPVLKNISFQVQSGQTFGIVGESGTGKTTLGKIIAGIENATGGEIYFRGESIKEMNKEAFSRYRRRVQMLFQDPEGSLNPKKTVHQSLDEILELIKLPKKERKITLEKIMQTVGLSSELLGRLPSQISGGQNQRVALARILLLEPEVIILDEPTSALDISVQAQILNLLKELQENKRLTYIFISHDKDVIQFMCHKTAKLADGNLAT